MNIYFRKAERDDLEIVVQLLAEDKLGQLREDYRLPLPQQYQSAFDRIINDSNQNLMVIENEEKRIVGTLQLSFIPYLTYQGGIRAQIEAVRIHKDHRGQGIGEKVFLWAIEEARQKGAHLLQLTTDKKRPEAIRFYQKLGFIDSHEGMKMHFTK